MHFFKFDVHHDGDFYHEKNFSIIGHEDYSFIMEKSIENIKLILNTFKSKRSYVYELKKELSHFLELIEDPKKLNYYSDDEEETWFEKDDNGNLLDFSFYYSTGNQYISISKTSNDFKIEQIPDGFLINFNSPS